jgi:hypothetical protein
VKLERSSLRQSDPLVADTYTTVLANSRRTRVAEVVLALHEGNIIAWGVDRDMRAVQSLVDRLRAAFANPGRWLITAPSRAERTFGSCPLRSSVTPARIGLF